MPLICTSSAIPQPWHPRSMRSSTRRTARGDLVNEVVPAPRSNLPLLILFLVTKRFIGKSSHNGNAFELPPGRAGHRFPRPSRDVSHLAQRGANAPLHAGRNTSYRKGTAPADSGGRRHADSPREYVPFIAASRSRSLPAHRRHPRFHELETLGADGLGWVSNFLAAAFARDERGGRGLSELPGREDDPAQPGS